MILILTRSSFSCYYFDELAIYFSTKSAIKYTKVSAIYTVQNLVNLFYKYLHLNISQKSWSHHLHLRCCFNRPNYSHHSCNSHIYYRNCNYPHRHLCMLPPPPPPTPLPGSPPEVLS